MLPIDLTIFSLQDARRSSARGVEFTHAIQILDDPMECESWPRLACVSLRLRFEDIVEAPEHFSNPGDDHGCTEQDIARIIAFAKLIPAGAHLVTHCQAGHSRSPAAAIIIIAAMMKATPADVCVAGVMKLFPESVPNLRMIQMADALLSREGRLYEQAKAIYDEYHASKTTL